MTEVISIDEGFGAWYAELDDRTKDDIGRAVMMLEKLGVTLPYPYPRKQVPIQRAPAYLSET